jgi:Ca-activated chloride channel homolog
MQPSDAKIDTLLQAVPLPEGLLERLRAMPLADDEGLDAALRDVPAPEGLLKRLTQIPLSDDDGLDETLRHVPVPTRLMASWRRRAKQQDRLLRLNRLAVALSLLVALAIGYFGAKMIDILPTVEVAKLPAPLPPEPESLGESWLAEGRPAAPLETDDPAQPREVPLVEVEVSRPSDMAQSAVRSGPDWLLDVMPKVLGGTFDQLDDLPTRVVGLIPRGIDWPRAPGANWAFLLRYGVHPFVSPAAHPKLTSTIVPLGIDPASYDLAQRYLEEGTLPPPDKVRTEEFLAAPDYDFPAPDKQPMGIVVAAGPSPFGGEGLSLLQIGVQARRVPDQQHAPVHLVLVVDCSGSMRWGGRVEMIRRALRDVALRLHPADRLSLVRFGHDAHLLVQDVGPGQVSQFLAAVDSLTSGGPTNLGAGLNEAYTLAQQEVGPNRPAVRVVLLTDGLLELEEPQVERLRSRAIEAAGRGMPLYALDLGQGNRGDPELAGLAAAGHGEVHRVTNTNQVRWALQEIISGRSQLVAHDAQLKVTFNPKTVLEYRLLGHEAIDFAGMTPQPPQADFHDGQSATALYEVRLAATGPQEVATVELTWYRPEDVRSAGQTEPQKASRKVDRKQFASTFTGAAPSLQQAALVAELAETLRTSPFMRAPRTSLALYHLWSLAGQVDSEVKQKRSFAEFLAMVEQAIKAKPPATRGGGRRP